MIKDIFLAMGPFCFIVACVIGFVILLIASSWLAYFTARSWKRGVIAA